MSDTSTEPTPGGEEKKDKPNLPPIPEEVREASLREVDEPKEKKRLSWPWIVCGNCTVFFIAGVIGFIILCGWLYESCKDFGKLPNT